MENTAKEENVRELNKEFIAFEKRHGNRYFCCLIVQFIWVSEYLDSMDYGLCRPDTLWSVLPFPSIALLFSSPICFFSYFVVPFILLSTLPPLITFPLYFHFFPSLFLPFLSLSFLPLHFLSIHFIYFFSFFSFISFHLFLFIFFIITFRQGIEDAIVNRRREEYEEKVALNPYDYDAWFDYLRLEETEGMDHEKTRGWIY